MYMKNKGISLIVLIITCVVIIILATAIIVNIAQTNMIENAKEAVVKQDFKTMQDELTLYKADKYADTLGKFKAEDLDVTDKAEIEKIIPSIVGTKYEAYVLIEDGCIAISEDMPEQERKWAMEALGLIKTSTNRPTEPETPVEPEEAVTPVIKPGDQVATVNSTFTGGEFAYNNPVIPVGFVPLANGASWTDNDKNGIVDGWNDGLVIVDESGNEFVWVPCTTDKNDTTKIQYTRRLEEYPKAIDMTSASDDSNAFPMKDETTTVNETDQITKYGGFYIGRYEAGVPNKTGTPSNSTGKPTVQQGATVWTNISYTNASANAKTFINTVDIKSGLVTGSQWDTVCAWIQSEKDSENNSIHDVTNSVSWGNHSNTTGNAQYDTEGVKKISGTKQVAGYSEYWKAKNIYDFAGNTWEWTTEKSSYLINRGGYYSYNGSTYPASFRGTRNTWDMDVFISFRIVLYVM